MINVMLGGIGAVLAALAIWAYFAFLWLKTGAWPDATAIDGACWLVGCAADSWAYWPTDWLGVHRALTWLSPAGALFSTGSAAVWIAISASD